MYWLVLSGGQLSWWHCLCRSCSHPQLIVCVVFSLFFQKAEEHRRRLLRERARQRAEEEDDDEVVYLVLFFKYQIWPEWLLRLDSARCLQKNVFAWGRRNEEMQQQLWRMVFDELCTPKRQRTHVENSFGKNISALCFYVQESEEERAIPDNVE